MFRNLLSLFGGNSIKDISGSENDEYNVKKPSPDLGPNGPNIYYCVMDLDDVGEIKLTDSTNQEKFIHDKAMMRLFQYHKLWTSDEPGGQNMDPKRPNYNLTYFKDQNAIVELIKLVKKFSMSDQREVGLLPMDSVRKESQYYIVKLEINPTVLKASPAEVMGGDLYLASVEKLRDRKYKGEVIALQMLPSAELPEKTSNSFLSQLPEGPQKMVSDYLAGGAENPIQIKAIAKLGNTPARTFLRANPDNITVVANYSSPEPTVSATPRKAP